ncbi:MAG: S41 family peptidase [Pyrinomonadaceae bacterium]|nr:S41 family peptidase [Pyrinomonadaceae bacterium]
MKNFLAIMMILLTVCAGAATVSAQSEDMTIDGDIRSNVITVMLQKLNRSYVFPEVAKQIETSIKQKLEKKEYDRITSARDFAKQLTEDLQAVSRDKHMRVRFSEKKLVEGDRDGEPSEDEKARFARLLKTTNYGFEQVEWLPGNIGYIRLRGFTDEKLGAETVAAAMNFVKDTDALIFDLRKNGGGNPAMVAHICSYLFGEKKVHLNDLFWREGNETNEFWTDPNVAGKKYAGDVYVLTSSRTFSGAEEFSNNLKVLKRATIVGETTGGGANPGSYFRLTDHFEVFIPTGRAINPITKTNWEGTGVEPDVKVSRELALKTAHLLALKKSLQNAREEDEKRALKRLIEDLQKEIAEEKTPNSVK